MAPRKKSVAESNSPGPISMADLARELRVSLTTISRTLSDYHSMGLSMKQKMLKISKKT